MFSDAPVGIEKRCPFLSAGIFSTVKAVEMEHDLQFYAALAILIKYFDWSRLDRGIRLPLDLQRNISKIRAAKDYGEPINTLKGMLFISNPRRRMCKYRKKRGPAPDRRSPT
jgi:hypothetical protein